MSVKPGVNDVVTVGDDFGNGVDLALYDANRKIIYKQRPNAFDATAIKFIAPKSAIFVAISYPANYIDPYPFPDDYTIGLHPSCAHNARTLCKATVGKPTTVKFWSEYNDSSWYQINLQKGGTYTASGASNMGFYDTKGKALVALAPDFHSQPKASLKAPYTGRYFVAAKQTFIHHPPEEYQIIVK